jgi:hypothetical protein
MHMHGIPNSTSNSIHMVYILVYIIIIIIIIIP